MPNEEFEELMREQNPSGYLARADNGEYIVPGIQKKWEGYQLRQPEIDALKANIATVTGASARLAARSEELEAGVERLRADAERMDWLIAGGIYALEARIDEVYGFEVNLSRETIDAAMKGTK